MTTLTKIKIEKCSCGINHQLHPNAEFCKRHVCKKLCPDAKPCECTVPRPVDFYSCKYGECTGFICGICGRLTK